MNLAIQRIRVYFKLILLVTLAAVAVLVAFQNRGNEVTIWFFHEYTDINVLWLMLSTGGAAILGWWVLRSTLSVLHDLRSLQGEEERRKHAQEQKAMADRLAVAEAKLQARGAAVLTPPGEGASAGEDRPTGPAN